MRKGYNFYESNYLDIQNYLQAPHKYVFPFVIKEKTKEREIITYNNSKEFGKKLRSIHESIAKAFEENFSQRNKYSFAYHKGISCANALDDHMKSNHFITLDIHHFFQSISKEKFFKEYPHVFNDKWKNLIECCFYNDYLSIGYVTSPIISDYFMSNFNNKIEEYLNNHPKLHYSLYADDMLISSEEDEIDSLLIFKEFIKKELDNLGLELNEKKTKQVSLDNDTHNSISFLGLNISRLDEITNKITISKRYILFLLYLIKKSKNYHDGCRALLDEINSRVAYLAYSSRISYDRFQKKHMNLFNEPYHFVFKKANDRKVGTKSNDIVD